MKKTILILTGMLASVFTMAQTDSVQIKKGDTLRVGRMVIIKDGERSTSIKIEPEQKNQRNNDFKEIEITHRKKQKESSNISTNWWIMDIGLNQFSDKTNYNAANIQTIGIGPNFAPTIQKDWFSLQNGKSINVNLWFFMQRLSLIKKVVNLKYGMGLEYNNYRYENPIEFSKNPFRVTLVPSTINTFSKNKLVANYVTVPMMLNFNLTPHKKNGFGFSAGMSAGYLYSSYQKTVSSAHGKQKLRSNFDLAPWKVSYVGELQMGPVKLYGSLATKSMFEKGLNQVPYNVGFRFSNW